jgi:PST family polysaccharide transporter
MYTSTNTLIVGLFADLKSLAEFHAAERVISAFRGLLGPLFQAAFPAFSREAKSNPGGAKKSLRGAMVVAFPIFLLIGLALYMFAEDIMTFLFGTQFARSAEFLKLMAPIPLLIAWAHCVSSLGLLAFGETRAWSLTIVFAVVGNYVALVLLASVVPIPTAASIAMFAAELFAFCMGAFLFFRLPRDQTRQPV